MYLFMENAMPQVWSDCDTLRITVMPRRGAALNPTRVRMRCEGHADYLRTVEDLAPEAATDWVWTGSVADARRITDLVLRTLHRELRDDAAIATLPPEEASLARLYGELLDRYIDDDLRQDATTGARPLMV
jgi:hypothetical protein